MKQNTKSYGDSLNQAINILGESTTIKGDIVTNNDIRIDGELQGTLDAKGRIVIGPKGKIEGEIKCKNIEVEGSIKGKVSVTDLLTMKSSAKIEGEIVAGKLAIEPGAVFTGNCNMGNNTPVKSNAQEKQN